MRPCEVSRVFRSRPEAVTFAATLIVATRGAGHAPGFVSVVEQRAAIGQWPTTWRVFAPDIAMLDAIQALASSLLTRPRCKAVREVERQINRGECRFTLPGFVRGRKVVQAP